MTLSTVNKSANVCRDTSHHNNNCRKWWKIQEDILLKGIKILNIAYLLDGLQGRLQIGRRMITNLRYADDIIVLATSEAELHAGVGGSPRPTEWVSCKYSLLINVNNTKVMASDGIACCILVQNEQLEQMNTFMYIGSLITEDGECTTEFRIRLNRGQAIGASLQKIRKSHIILISTKIRLMKALEWPVATCDCKSWSLRKNEERHSKENKWVDPQQSWSKEGTIKAMKLASYGHTTKKQGSCLEKEIMQGTMPGAHEEHTQSGWTTSRRGQDLPWKSVRMAEDRDKWRNYVHGVANLRIMDGRRTEQNDLLELGLNFCCRYEYYLVGRPLARSLL